MQPTERASGRAWGSSSRLRDMGKPLWLRPGVAEVGTSAMLREDNPGRTTMRFKASAVAAVIAFGLIGSATYAEELAPGTRVQTTPGITRTVLHKTDFPGNQYATLLFLAEIAPGATVPRHTHPGVESAYVVEGKRIL
jgi:hypothetical protein